MKGLYWLQQKNAGLVIVIRVALKLLVCHSLIIKITHLNFSKVNAQHQAHWLTFDIGPNFSGTHWCVTAWWFTPESDDNIFNFIGSTSCCRIRLVHRICETETCIWWLHWTLLIKFQHTILVTIGTFDLICRIHLQTKMKKPLQKTTKMDWWANKRYGFFLQEYIIFRIGSWKPVQG